MLSVEEIRNHLQYMVLSRVSYETGVDRGALIRLKNGTASRPSHSSIRAISKFITGLRDE